MALQFAAEHIRKTNKSHQKRKSEYKISDYNNMLSSEPGTYEEIFSKTWEITFEILKTEENSEKAINMLNIMSYLGPNDVPEELFLSDKPNEIFAITDLLEKYSIVRLEDSMLSVHGLVRKVRMLELQKQQIEQETLKEAMVLLKNLIEKPDGVNRSVPYMTSVWIYACKYDTLIERYIVQDIADKSAYTTFFHLAARGSSYEVFEAIIQSVEKNNLGKLKQIINAKDHARGGHYIMQL
jgi:hypothetical protein